MSLGKEALAKGEFRERDIAQAMKRYDQEVYPIRETLPDKSQHLDPAWQWLQHVIVARKEPSSLQWNPAWQWLIMARNEPSIDCSYKTLVSSHSASYKTGYKQR